MLTIGVITLFPEMLSALNAGVVARAQQNGLLNIQAVNLRDFTTDTYRTVDDRPYGGGPGMLMLYEPLQKAIHAGKSTLGSSTTTIYLSPQGKLIDQAQIAKWSKLDSILFIAGRYEGIDERIIQHEVDAEYSIGDYVLSGGELPVMVVIDAIARLIPGVLGNTESAANDSLSDGLLDHPHYTRPENIAGKTVPSVLLSGNHAHIERWRLKQRLGNTWLKRPDLLQSLDQLTREEAELLAEFQSEHRSKRHD